MPKEESRRVRCEIRRVYIEVWDPIGVMADPAMWPRDGVRQATSVASSNYGRHRRHRPARSSITCSGPSTAWAWMAAAPAFSKSSPLCEKSILGQHRSANRWCERHRRDGLMAQPRPTAGSAGCRISNSARAESPTRCGSGIANPKATARAVAFTRLVHLLFLDELSRVCLRKPCSGRLLRSAGG